MRAPFSRAFYAIVSLTLAALLGALRAPAAPAQPTLSWDQFVTTFIDDYFKANPSFAVEQGRHEFDGQLPDWSAAGLAHEIARLKAERAAALRFADSDLSSAQRFERDYLIDVVRRDLFWLESSGAPQSNPAFYADTLDPDVYVSRDYAPLPVRLAAYTRYARAVPVALAQIQANLHPPLSAPLVAIGRLAIGGMADFYEKDVPKVFAAALHGPAADAFAAANATAIKATRAFDAWLASQEPTAHASFALGPEKFRLMLRETEAVDLSLDELDAIAQRDLARNTRALADACAAYAPGESIDIALARAHAHKPEGGVIPVARQELAELRQFVADHDLVTIPGREEALVAPAPAYKSWDFAYIDIPGPYENGLPSFYCVAAPDPGWSAQKQRDYIPSVGSLLFTSVHEVWPGHFLQFFHANRAPSLFGRVFVGYAFSEGWAHYTEEMMWDAGLGDGSPELHIGQLEEALLRDMRFVCAIGLHTKGMSVAEATRLFRERAHKDEASAEQEANRGTFDPAYLNYTLGKLMIRKLRDDWTATRGGRPAWKAFHDEFLRYGGPPIPLVRRAMLGTSDRGSLF